MMEAVEPVVQDRPELTRPLYVSQIKLFGIPIIAPCMTDKKRAEMRILKQRAIEAERRLEAKHLLYNPRNVTNSLVPFETQVALPRNESASNEATNSSRASAVEPASPQIPNIEIFSPSLSGSTRTIADANPNPAESLSAMSAAEEPTDFSKIYQSFPPLDVTENTIESQLCFKADQLDLNSSGSIDLNLDLTASSVCSPYRPSDLSLVDSIRAPDVSLVSTTGALAAASCKRRDFQRYFRHFLEQKLGQLDAAWADSLTDFSKPQTDASLDVPALVRQNSYTLLDGPSPLIIAHLEKSQAASTPKPRPRSASQDSTNRSPSSSQATNRSPFSSQATNRSPSSSQATNRSPASSHAARPLRRRGWDLDRAKQFWSSAETLDRMFALPRAQTGPAKARVVSGNRSLPASASPSPSKSLRRHTAFSSLDGLAAPTPRRPIRRSLFKPAESLPKRPDGPTQALGTSGKPSGDWPKEQPSSRNVGSPHIARGVAKSSATSTTQSSREVNDESRLGNVAEPPRASRDAVGSSQGAVIESPRASESGRGVDTLVLRLQRDHQRQMDALLERQRADQRRMQSEFAEQEQKLLAAIATATEEGSSCDNGSGLRQAESSLGDCDRMDTPASPPATDISMRLVESVTSRCSLVESVTSRCSLVESVSNRCSLVESVTSPRPLAESVPNSFRLVELVPSPQLIERPCGQVAEKLSASLDGDPDDWLAVQNAGTPRSQRALSAIRNIHNAREELAWEKENVCDSYSGSELSSLTTRSGSRRADAFRPLYQNGQTVPGTASSDRSSEGTASSDGSDASCTSWHLRRNTPAPPEASPREHRAANVITAGARGFLVRRLLRTGHVRDIRRTIQDVTLAALQLHQENHDTVNEEDVELGRRLIHQLNASWLALYETFFVISTRERLALIAADRARIGHATRPMASGGGRLSSATQRSLRRKQASSSPEGSGRGSIATSRSFSRPASAVSATSRHSGKTTPRLGSSTPRDLSAPKPKPWR